MAATNGKSNGRQNGSRRNSDRRNGNGRDLNTVFDDALVFPVLTEGVNLDNVGTTGSSAMPGSAPLGQIAENAIRQVLGWRPRANDSKGFTAALTQTFSLKDVNGHTEWNYTPRGFAVQADLGAVTGAQAAIYKRAKVTLDQVLPLLDGLTALNDPDAEDVQAARVLVRNAFTELVQELAAEGGPRVQRVDDYFVALLDDGHLDTLKERLGLENARVNTIEEEQNLTNFIVLEQYADSLRDSWDDLKPFFNRSGNNVFLGTQSVLLSRELDVLAESVQEAYFAMDSVFLGQAERQTTQLKFGVGETPLTIAELLGWVRHAATDEIPRLIQDAGKDGVAGSTPLLTRLLALVSAAEVNTTLPNHPFDTRRVQRAVDEVEGHLAAALELARGVSRIQPAPEIVDDLDLVYMPNGLIRITVPAKHLQDGARIYLERAGANGSLIHKDGAFVSLNLTADPQTLSAIFDVSNDPNNLTWKLVVENLDEQSDEIEITINFSGYKPPVTPAPPAPPAPPPPIIPQTDNTPRIVNISPTSGRCGSELTVGIHGADFESAMDVVIENIASTSITVVNANYLTAKLSIESDAPDGRKLVSVTNTRTGKRSQDEVWFEILKLDETRGVGQ